MNAEEKQALIERCGKISEWREKYGDYANVMLPAVEAQQIAQIALAALTAPPVKAPDTKCIGWVKDSIKEHDEKWRDAIRAAGYQVESE